VLALLSPETRPPGVKVAPAQPERLPCRLPAALTRPSVEIDREADLLRRESEREADIEEVLLSFPCTRRRLKSFHLEGGASQKRAIREGRRVSGLLRGVSQCEKGHFWPPSHSKGVRASSSSQSIFVLSPREICRRASSFVHPTASQMCEWRKGRKVGLFTCSSCLCPPCSGWWRR